MGVLHRMHKLTTPIRPNPISNAAGPPVDKALPEPTNKPAPIEPPIAIMLKWRLFNVWLSWLCSSLAVRRRNDSGVTPRRVQKDGRDAFGVVMIAPLSAIQEVALSRLVTGLTTGRGARSFSTSSMAVPMMVRRIFPGWRRNQARMNLMWELCRTPKNHILYGRYLLQPIPQSTWTQLHCYHRLNHTHRSMAPVSLAVSKV
jgi:hypothetical protein